MAEKTLGQTLAEDWAGTSTAQPQTRGESLTQTLAKEWAAPPPPPPPQGPGFRDYAAVAGQGLLELPQQAGASFRRAASGMSGLIAEGESPEIAAARAEAEKFQAYKESRLGKDSFFGRMVDPASVASSATGVLGTGLMLAAPLTGPAAPAVGVAGAALAGASMPGMYRDVTYATLAEAIQAEEAKVGRSLTAPERQALFDANADAFRKQGAVEVGGEALGLGISMLASPAGGAAVKGFIKGGTAGAKVAVAEVAKRSALRNALGAGAADLTGELAGESWTQVEQDINAQQLGLPNMGLDRSPSGYAEGFKEVLPGVLGTAGLVTGVTGGAQKLSEVIQKKAAGNLSDADARERALEVLKFKAEHPDAPLSDADAASFIENGPLEGAAPMAQAEPPAEQAPPAEVTPEPVLQAPPAEVTPTPSAQAAPAAQVAPERLGLPAPTNISLPSGEVLPAQQFYRMLNERLDAVAGGMTKEEVIRSRRRLAKEEQQFFEIQAIKDLPEAQRSAAEKLKLKKYSQWLEPTVPAEAVTEQKELVNDLSPMPITRTETRQEVQEPPVRVQGGEVVKPLTPVTEPATLPETLQGGSTVTTYKRTNPPQVAGPTVLEPKVSVNLPLRDGTTQKHNGKGYAFPGFEEYRFALIPPSGSKAGATKAGYRVVEVSTGSVISESPVLPYSPSTEADALERAQGLLQSLPKATLESAIQKKLGLGKPASTAPVLTENPDLQPTPPTNDPTVILDTLERSWSAQEQRYDAIEAEGFDDFWKRRPSKQAVKNYIVERYSQGNTGGTVTDITAELSQMEESAYAKYAGETQVTPASQEGALSKNVTRSHFTIPAGSAVKVPDGTIFREDVITMSRGPNKGKVTGRSLYYKRPNDATFIKIKPTEPKKNIEGLYEQVVKSERIEAKFSEALDPISSLSAEISIETGKPVAAGTFTQVAPPRGQEKVFEALGQTLGKNIIFFEAKNAPMQFSGVTGIVEGTIFININTPRPHLAIAGHEFLHDLKREDPEVYDSLRQTILDTIPAAMREAMWAGLNGKRKEEGRPLIDRAGVDEELIADFFGEQFTTKEFWAKVERRNPEGFAGLVQRLIDFLGRIAQAFTGKQREDLIKAQDVAAEALARYVKRNPEPIPAQVDPRFSETPKLNIKAAAEAVRSGKVTTAALPTALKWMPFRTTVDIFKDTLPQLPAVYEATTQREAMASSIITDFGLIGKELAKTKDTAHRVAAAAEDASFYQMKPQLDLYSQDWITEAMRGVEGTKPETKDTLLKGAQTTWEAAGMQKSTGKTFREAYAESKLSYDALKTDELKEQYLIAVSKMDILRDQMLDEGIRLIESTTEVTEDMPQEQQDRLTALRAEQLTAIRSAYNKLKGNYWPFYRVGDYLLSYVNKETGERESKAFRTVFERDYVAKSLLETRLVDESSMKLTKKESSTPGVAGIPKGYNDALTKAIEEKAIFEATKGIDPANTEAIEAATKQAIADSALTTQTLQEVWLSFQPETSLAKHQMRRKNIRGWDSDMVRGFLDYGASHAAKISHMRHGRRIDDMIAEMYADVKNRPGDTTREMAVLNDIKARNDMAKKPVASSWLAKALGTATTLKYMTSPSIALVQMTQLGILTLPRLATMRVGGKEVGVTAAANALRKGIQAAFSKNYGRDKLEEVEEIYSLMHSEVTSELRAEQPKYKDVPIGTPIYSEAEIQAMIDKLSPYQKQLLALQEAMHRGILDISMTHEVIDQIQGGDPNAPHVKLANLMMTFMRESETASRKAAILSAFEVAGGEKDFFAGMAAVKDVVDSTLFNYSKSAKGVMLQGDTLRVLTQFQTFRINAIGKLFTLFRQTIKGADAETRSAAKRELIGIFGMSGMLAGALGMPILPIIFKLFDSLVGDDGDEPSEEQFRKWLEQYFGETAAGVALEGLPSLLGLSLSRRIGLGDVVGFGQEAPARLTGSGLANWYATQAMGPSYSMVAGVVKGYDEIFNEGEVMQGLQSSLPKPVGDMIKAIGYATEGVKTSKGKRLLAADQISTDEVVFQALGFAPYEISRLKTEEFTRDKMSTGISKRRGQIIQDFAKAFADKDDTSDEREAVKEFNQEYPLFAIGSSNLASAVRAIRMGELGIDTPMERKIKLHQQR